MNKLMFITTLLIFVLLTINAGVSQELDNQTLDDLKSTSQYEDSLQSCDNDLIGLSKNSTHISVESNTDFDVVGDYFKVKLSDVNNNSIKNTKITFTINGVNYSKNTDSNGIASLQLNLNDGKYNIASKFEGNMNYASSSITTQVLINNTRIVGDDLTNSEIQNILDSAKDKNIILFTGKSYEDVNLVINKRLTLISNSNTILKSSHMSPTILFTGKSSSYSSVKGFNIQSNSTAISILNSNYIIISNNTISTKSNAVVVENANYINITGNNIVKNSNTAIRFVSVSNSHISDNKINNNAVDGIQLENSNKIYIYSNSISGNGRDGIHITDNTQNLYVTYNNITKNGVNGVNVEKAGDNIKIASNQLSSNSDTGILIKSIGSNSIQSNVIVDNAVNGLKFANTYVKPENQDVSYNVIYNNFHKDVDAKDTYYQENGKRLELGDNWYGDWGFVCPKIKTNNLLFKVSQVGKNQFRAEFLDSNGNIASLLPDRTLTYNSNGQTLSITVKGGIATFTVNADDGELISAVVDKSRRDNSFDASIKNTANVVNGKSPTYSYPSIQYESNYDMGNGDGDGMGDGNGGSSKQAKSQKGDDFTGNGTTMQNINPSNSPNQINAISQNYQTQNSAQSSSSDSGSGSGEVSQSVVKQILIDEDDFFKVTGISFIVVLMIITIAFYYRDDIKQMNAKK